MHHGREWLLLSVLAAAIWMCPCSAAFIEASQHLPGPARALTGKNFMNDAVDLYELANAQLTMDEVPTGKVSFKPNDLQNINSRPVYDPGDGEF